MVVVKPEYNFLNDNFENMGQINSTPSLDLFSFDKIVESDSDNSLFNCDLEDSSTEPSATSRLPKKSRQKYKIVYTKFEKWCEENKVETINEKTMLAYFQEKSVELKPSTLWSMYSMIRTLMNMKKKIDISKYTNLLAFLKRISKGYKAKKSRVFTKQEITKFLVEAEENKFLLLKVALIVGLSGSCTRDEMANLLIQNINYQDSFIEVAIKETKNKTSRNFLITPGNISGVNLVETVRKYACLRPSNTDHHRFFIKYLNGKCIKQPVGIHTFGSVAKRIAQYLELPNPEEYTAHFFKRTSATLLADSETDLLALKKYCGWKYSGGVDER